MTIHEKIKKAFTDNVEVILSYGKHGRLKGTNEAIIECEKITETVALKFADWLSKQDLSKTTTKQQFEIFKSEIEIWTR